MLAERAECSIVAVSEAEHSNRRSHLIMRFIDFQTGLSLMMSAQAGVSSAAGANSGRTHSATTPIKVGCETPAHGL
jgi:hypothetical protein